MGRLLCAVSRRGFLHPDAEADPAFHPSAVKGLVVALHIGENLVGYAQAHFAACLGRLINESKTLLRRRRRILPMAQPPESGSDEPPGADAALQEALFSLPPKYRVPLTLTCLDGYTMREAARMLGVPEGTVKARVHRARQQLKELLGEEETDDAR